MAVMRKMHASLQGRCAFDLFTHQPELFRACPWVASARAITDEAAIRAYPHGKRVMFELEGISRKLAQDAMTLGASKLPIRTRFVERHTLGGE